MANRINIFKKIKQDLEEVSERKKYLKYFKSCLTEQSLNEFNTCFACFL